MNKEFKSFWQLVNPLILSLKSKGVSLTDYPLFTKYSSMYDGSKTNPKKYLIYIISQMKNSGIKFVNPSKKSVQNHDIVGLSDDIFYTWTEVINIAGNPELKCFNRWIDVVKILYDINNLWKYPVKQCYLIKIYNKEIKRRQVMQYIYGGNNSYYTNGNISGNNVLYNQYTTSNYSSLYTVAAYEAQRDALDSDWGTYAIEGSGDGTGYISDESTYITRNTLGGSYYKTISPLYSVYSESYDNSVYNAQCYYSDTWGNSFDTNKLPYLPSSSSDPSGYWYKTYGNEVLKYKYLFVDYTTWNALPTASRTAANAVSNMLQINNVPTITHYYHECQYENTRDIVTNEYGGISAPTTYLDNVYSSGTEIPTKNGNYLEYTLTPSLVYDSLIDKDGHFGRGKRVHKYIYQVGITGGSGLLSRVTEIPQI